MLTSSLIIFAIAILHATVLEGLVVTHTTLLRKLRTEKLPLFEFRNNVEELLASSNEEFETENLVVVYLDLLRDHYYDEFVQSCKNHTNRIEFVESKQVILRECESAMQAAIPTIAPSHWSYQGQCAELAKDIDLYIDQIPATNEQDSIGPSESESETEKSNQASKFNKPLKSSIWHTSFKWVLGKAVLLLINFAQNEWRRRVEVHAAEKRLAEVPEFPLL